VKKQRSLYNDPNLKWDIVGKLVERHGTEIEKLAWALCRGQAAEWRLGIGTTSMEEIKEKLRRKINAR